MNRTLVAIDRENAMSMRIQRQGKYLLISDNSKFAATAAAAAAAATAATATHHNETSQIKTE